MAHQIFLISLHATHCNDDDVREELAQLIHNVGGYILMAAGQEALIAAFDEQWLPVLRRHEAVALCGGLNLDPNGAAADKLRHLFAANVAAQLRARAASDTPAQADTLSPARTAVPRHRPLVWHHPAQHAREPDSGVRISTVSTTQR